MDLFRDTIQIQLSELIVTMMTKLAQITQSISAHMNVFRSHICVTFRNNQLRFPKDVDDS